MRSILLLACASALICAAAPSHTHATTAQLGYNPDYGGSGPAPKDSLPVQHDARTRIVEPYILKEYTSRNYLDTASYRKLPAIGAEATLTKLLPYTAPTIAAHAKASFREYSSKSSTDEANQR